MQLPPNPIVESIVARLAVKALDMDYLAISYLPILLFFVSLNAGQNMMKNKNFQPPRPETLRY